MDNIRKHCGIIHGATTRLCPELARSSCEAHYRLPPTCRKSLTGFMTKIQRLPNWINRLLTPSTGKSVVKKLWPLWTSTTRSWKPSAGFDLRWMRVHLLALLSSKKTTTAWARGYGQGIRQLHGSCPLRYHRPNPRWSVGHDHQACEPLGRSFKCPSSTAKTVVFNGESKVECLLVCGHSLLSHIGGG